MALLSDMKLCSHGGNVWWFLCLYEDQATSLGFPPHQSSCGPRLRDLIVKFVIRRVGSRAVGWREHSCRSAGLLQLGEAVNEGVCGELVT